jgi:hypothetical protein
VCLGLLLVQSGLAPTSSFERGRASQSGAGPVGRTQSRPVFSLSLANSLCSLSTIITSRNFTNSCHSVAPPTWYPSVSPNLISKRSS